MLAARPIADDMVHQLLQGEEAEGLGKVGVGAQLIGFLDILFHIGATEHDDGDLSVMGVGFQGGEGFKAIHDGHFEVQDDEVGEVIIPAIGKLSLAIHIAEQLEAIGHGFQEHGDGDVAKRMGEQLQIRGAILRYEHDKIATQISTPCFRCARRRNLPFGGGRGGSLPRTA